MRPSGARGFDRSGIELHRTENISGISAGFSETMNRMIFNTRPGFVELIWTDLMWRSLELFIWRRRRNEMSEMPDRSS
jgi:hypothetical protein